MLTLLMTLATALAACQPADFTVEIGCSTPELSGVKLTDDGLWITAKELAPGSPPPGEPVLFNLSDSVLTKHTGSFYQSIYAQYGFLGGETGGRNDGTAPPPPPTGWEVRDGRLFFQGNDQFSYCRDNGRIIVELAPGQCSDVIRGVQLKVSN